MRYTYGLQLFHPELDGHKEKGRFKPRAAARVADIERIALELESAREMRHSFYPAGVSHIENLDYHGECQPAEEAGGDFFDFVDTKSPGLLMSVGDVCGKGIPAAIMVTGLQASLRTAGANSGESLSATIKEINRMVWELSPTGFYVTMFYARADARRGILRYVNAGHQPALLVKKNAGIVERLESTGTVLGLSLRSLYEQRTILLEPGDTLVAFTDGVADAVDPEGYFLAEDVFVDIVRRGANAGASELVREIMNTVYDHTRGAVNDDRTVVVVRYTPAASAERPRRGAVELACACAA
jgi:sigma-B regulation protein RsbU (phosphoserine phosphatase)